MNRKKYIKGVSLIVLVITIIVIIILTGSVILSISKNNPIAAAQEAKFKNDIQTFNTDLSIWLSNEYVNTSGLLNTSSLNATKTTGDYKNLNIQQIVKSMSNDYADKLIIRRSKLEYIGTDLTERKWAKECGLINALQEVKDYVIYYDTIDNTRRNQIAAKDLAVLESAYYNRSDVEFIKASGTIALAYIPISEVNASDSEILNMLEANDFLYENGVKKTIAGGGIYLTNLASQHYRDVIMQIIQTRAINKSFDGIFIDCMDSAESRSTPAEYAQFKLGYEEILQKFRQKYGGTYIIQNRAFNTVMDVSNKYIDGLLWESFGAYEGNVSGWYSSMINNMTQLQSKGIKIFAVSTSATGIPAANLSNVDAYTQKLGYLYYHTPYDHYNAWPF